MFGSVFCMCSRHLFDHSCGCIQMTDKLNRSFGCAEKKNKQACNHGCCRQRFACSKDTTDGTVSSSFKQRLNKKGHSSNEVPILIFHQWLESVPHTKFFSLSVCALTSCRTNMSDLCAAMNSFIRSPVAMGLKGSITRRPQPKPQAFRSHASSSWAQIQATPPPRWQPTWFCPHQILR